MKCVKYVQRLGVAEGNARIENDLQDCSREAVFPKCSFSRSVGESAERNLFRD